MHQLLIASLALALMASPALAGKRHGGGLLGVDLDVRAGKNISVDADVDVGKKRGKLISIDADVKTGKRGLLGSILGGKRGCHYC